MMMPGLHDSTIVTCAVCIRCVAIVHRSLFLGFCYVGLDATPLDEWYILAISNMESCRHYIRVIFEATLIAILKNFCFCVINNLVLILEVCSY